MVEKNYVCCCASLKATCILCLLWTGILEAVVVAAVEDEQTPVVKEVVVQVVDAEVVAAVVGAEVAAAAVASQ